jgi:predicted ABC-type ATPase
VIADTPRVRMFAGPNGSGKTTVKNELPTHLFKNYINPDDIEKSLRSAGSLDLNPFGLTITTQELREFFAASEFLRANGLDGVSDIIECRDGILTLNGSGIDSYFASVLSDFLRRKLLDSSKSFTFETVMSAPDKVELLSEARRRGYRTYLYFVATEDPAINVERVKNRVASGGHKVPESSSI